MKGLLIKDLRLTLKNYRMLIIFLGLAIFFVFSSTGVEFAIAYIMMFLGMSVMTTISFDEIDHSNAFLMTLPVTRKLYVQEKYVYGALSLLAGLIVGNVLGIMAEIVRPQGNLNMEFVIGSLATFIVYWNLVSVMIPIQLKFGGDNGRLVTIIIAAVMAALIIGGMKLVDFWSLDTNSLYSKASQMIEETKGLALVIPLLVLTLIVTIVSMMFSYKIVNKKQY